MESKDEKGVAIWSGLNAAGLVFLGVWAYGIVSNDWVLGLVFGWLPAVIMGVIAGLVVYGFTYGLRGMGASVNHRPDAPPVDPTTGMTIH